MLFAKAALALAAVVSVNGGYAPNSTNKTGMLAAESLRNLMDAVADGSLEVLVKKGVAQNCSADSISSGTVRIRREYECQLVPRRPRADQFDTISTLTEEETLDYTRAIKCPMAKPPRTDPKFAPGTKSRYDDFVVTHVNCTKYAHSTGSFLIWHRYYIWSCEEALRNECDYQGYLPYWNWGKSTQDPLRAPYFDGSALSQGSNGVYKEPGCIEPGLGGGCVEAGPYAGLQVNILAIAPVFDDVVPGPRFSYQPRCIRRDISLALSQRWMGDERSFDLLTSPLYQSHIWDFQGKLAGFGDGSEVFYSLHQAGHLVFIGDLAGDVYNTPSDPMFRLHHTQIDRTWWIWQNQDVANRALQIGGPRVWNLGGEAPLGDATIDDLIALGVNGEASPIAEHVSSVGGRYCLSIYRQSGAAVGKGPSRTGP